MSIFSGLFRSRDKPKNHIGSAFSFLFGSTTSGKTVNERCQWPLENPQFWPRKVPTVPIPHLELTLVTRYRAC